MAYDGELAELIPKVLRNYDFYFDKQESYRDVIRNEKLLFQRNADEVLRHIAEWSRSTP